MAYCIQKRHQSSNSGEYSQDSDDPDVFYHGPVVWSRQGSQDADGRPDSPTYNSGNEDPIGQRPEPVGSSLSSDEMHNGQNETTPKLVGDQGNYLDTKKDHSERFSRNSCISSKNMTRTCGTQTDRHTTNDAVEHSPYLGPADWKRLGQEAFDHRKNSTRSILFSNPRQTTGDRRWHFSVSNSSVSTHANTKNDEYGSPEWKKEKSFSDNENEMEDDDGVGLDYETRHAISNHSRRDATQASVFSLLVGLSKIYAPELSPARYLIPEVLALYQTEGMVFTGGVCARYNRIFPVLRALWPSTREHAVAFALQRHLATTRNPDDANRRMQSLCGEMANNTLSKTLYAAFMLYRSHVDDIYMIGKELATKRCYIHAALCFYLSTILGLQESKGSGALSNVELHIHEISLLARSMKNSKLMCRVILDYMIPLMKAMLQLLRLHHNPKHPGSEECEAWCLNAIGLCYHYCDEDGHCAFVNEQAIDLIKGAFKGEATTYLVYGACNKDAGLCYTRMGDYSTAIERYKIALDVYGALKWTNNEHVWIERLENVLSRSGGIFRYAQIDEILY